MALESMSAAVSESLSVHDAKRFDVEVCGGPARRNVELSDTFSRGESRAHPRYNAGYMKAVITVLCPECGGTLEIDVAHQKVLSHKRHIDLDDPATDKAAAFEDVFSKMKSKESAAENMFKTAQQDVKEGAKKIDALFGEVKKKIAEEKLKPDAGKNPNEHFWD